MKLNNGITVISIPDMSGLSGGIKKRWNKWIEALESGKYKQGRCRLLFEGAFCCLGVAQDLFKNELGCTWEGCTFNDLSLTYCSTSALIFPAMKFLGFDDRYGLSISVTDNLTSMVESLNLGQLNDSGVTFLEIATILKKALAGGFTS
jgi:hypothetical protein